MTILIIIFIAFAIFTLAFCFDTFKYLITLQFVSPLKEIMYDLPKPKKNLTYAKLYRQQQEREFSKQFWKHDLPILISVIVFLSASLAAFGIAIYIKHN